MFCLLPVGGGILAANSLPFGLIFSSFWCRFFLPLIELLVISYCLLKHQFYLFPNCLFPLQLFLLYNSIKHYVVWWNLFPWKLRYIFESFNKRKAFIKIACQRSRRKNWTWCGIACPVCSCPRGQNLVTCPSSTMQTGKCGLCSKRPHAQQKFGFPYFKRDWGKRYWGKLAISVIVHIKHFFS